jgi:hypothetical protein
MDSLIYDHHLNVHLTLRLSGTDYLDANSHQVVVPQTEKSRSLNTGKSRSTLTTLLDKTTAPQTPSLARTTPAVSASHTEVRT